MLDVFQSTCYEKEMQLNGGKKWGREKNKLNKRISHLFSIFLCTLVSCLLFFFLGALLLILVQQILNPQKR